jgi:hypothetical protein
MRKEIYRPAPLNREVADRKAMFAALNDFATSRQGFVISVPGDTDVTVEVLPDSALPAELIALGYDLHEAEPGERILASAIIERFSRRADGELEPTTPDSTAAVAEVRSHAGVVRVKRFTFEMP